MFYSIFFDAGGKLINSLVSRVCVERGVSNSRAFLYFALTDECAPTKTQVINTLGKDRRKKTFAMSGEKGIFADEKGGDILG